MSRFLSYRQLARIRDRVQRSGLRDDAAVLDDLFMIFQDIEAGRRDWGDLAATANISQPDGERMISCVGVRNMTTGAIEFFRAGSDESIGKIDGYLPG